MTEFLVGGFVVDRKDTAPTTLDWHILLLRAIVPRTTAPIQIIVQSPIVDPKSMLAFVLCSIFP
jgi:hypothetical protein